MSATLVESDPARLPVTLVQGDLLSSPVILTEAPNMVVDIVVLFSAGL